MPTFIRPHEMHAALGFKIQEHSPGSTSWVDCLEPDGTIETYSDERMALAHSVEMGDGFDVEFRAVPVSTPSPSPL